MRHAARTTRCSRGYAEREPLLGYTLRKQKREKGPGGASPLRTTVKVTPDGSGLGKDWIIECKAQAELYPLLVSAKATLEL